MRLFVAQDIPETAYGVSTEVVANSLTAHFKARLGDVTERSVKFVVRGLIGRIPGIGFAADGSAVLFFKAKQGNICFFFVRKRTIRICVRATK